MLNGDAESYCGVSSRGVGAAVRLVVPQKQFADLPVGKARNRARVAKPGTSKPKVSLARRFGKRMRALMTDACVRPGYPLFVGGSLSFLPGVQRQLSGRAACSGSPFFRTHDCWLIAVK